MSLNIASLFTPEKKKEFVELSLNVGEMDCTAMIKGSIAFVYDPSKCGIKATAVMDGRNITFICNYCRYPVYSLPGVISHHAMNKWHKNTRRRKLSTLWSERYGGYDDVNRLILKYINIKI